MGTRLPQMESGSAADSAAQVAAGLAKLALVFRHEAWRATGEHGLSPTQAQILAVVAGASQPIGLSTVADQLAITAGTASAAVSTLVGKGLVVKQRSADDGREIRLKLTAKGKRLAASAGEWPEAVLAAAAALSSSDQAGLVRGLVSLIRELQERGSVPTARMCVGCRFFRPNEYAGKSKPHHCQYIDAPIADSELRVDCDEMEPVDPELAPRLWTAFVGGKSLSVGKEAKQS
ncbi:MAG: winged helix-turn-helix transcriptional regulator [Phycisphaeraceae bacterium]|nr:winged helix-turn-helix transcriptional regulator [Phycisphaeraceae bacterium]